MIYGSRSARRKGWSEAQPPAPTHLNHHIIPHLGTDRLSDLTTPSIYQFDSRLRAAGTSLAMRRKILTSMKTLLSFAQKRALVAQNVALPAKIKGADRGERGPLREGVDYPSRADLKVLMDTSSSRWRPLLVTAVFTGMRASELRGLPWADVDLDQGVIHVRQRADAWARSASRSPRLVRGISPCPQSSLIPFENGVEGRPKRHNGKKDAEGLPITGAGHSHSRTGRQRKEHPESGKRVREPGAGTVRLARHYGFHALRHVAASLLIAYLNWTPKRVQQVMGHSSITVTYYTYGHLFKDKDADRDAMKKIEAAIAAA